MGQSECWSEVRGRAWEPRKEPVKGLAQAFRLHSYGKSLKSPESEGGRTLIAWAEGEATVYAG